MKRITNYPIKIEPSVNLLEVEFTEDSPGEPAHWQALHRLDLESQPMPFVVTNKAPHIFGDHPYVGDCRHILTYSISGIFTELYCWESDGWLAYGTSEETRGAVERFPSVRHVFADPVDLDRYLKLLYKMADTVAGLGHPSPSDAWEMMTILARAPHPLRIVHVACPLDELKHPGV